MAKLSKYYKVTNQMMIEYVTDYYNPDYEQTSTLLTEPVHYFIYEGLDNKVYYIDLPEDQDLNINMYKPVDPFNFVKFGDKSDSEYSYYLLKEAPTEDNPDYYKDYKQRILECINPENELVLHCSELRDVNIYYDRIRVHFIYGFLLDTLAGFTLLVKTTGKTLRPILSSKGRSRHATDDNGNPVFETVDDLDNKTVERLTYDKTELTMLDIFFPKEKIIYNIEWHKNPIYQNGSFYDRYVEFKVPSAYYMQLQLIDFSSQSVYGSTFGSNTATYVSPESIGSSPNYIYYQIGDTTYRFPRFSDEKLNEYYDNGNYTILPQYALPAANPEERYLYTTVMNDPNVIINFATVKEENASLIEYDDYTVETLIQDPINQISMKYNSNSDLFNVRLVYDEENKEVVYYPVFGVGTDAVELDYEIMKLIETGAIPMITEAFMDQMENATVFHEEYGDDAYKWIIYNELDVTYEYVRLIMGTEGYDENDTTYFHQHFANLIDYNQPNPEIAGPFWRSTFVPNAYRKANMTLKGISLEYTCRLINRMNNVEAIRKATLFIPPSTAQYFYTTQSALLSPLKTYKIVNRIVKNEVNPKNVVTLSNDSIVRSYYDATNLVVKDIGGTGLYTQGQMTLFLKHTSHNYMLRLFTLNEDNIRIPFDLTGPYRYKLVFPTLNGTKIQIRPNTDSGSLNLGIGQLVFYISEDQVKQIMKVPLGQRYFAIMTDTDNKDMVETTLYEGKVAYYS